MIEKTGNILIAIKISAHLRASDVLAVDLNERSRITTKLTKKGFRILEVKLAIRLLICIFPELLTGQSRYYTILIYGVSFARKSFI